jgi:uncharacterized membrane protein YphA (DoxX/SURF4 family)
VVFEGEYGMNVVVWVFQIMLAIAFLFSGLGKLLRRREDLQKQAAYVEDFTDGQVKAIGAAEVLGALGLILPAWTGIAPVLTPIAASGLALIMASAALVHFRRKEYQMIGVNAVLLVFAAFVATMRFGPYAY